jgi:hypothetical protein
MTRQLLIALATLATLLASAPQQASAAPACPAGSYSVVQSPDGSSLSILFDGFIAAPPQGRADCLLTIPLDLPAGMNLGVYRVDYRGFASLARREEAELVVDYNLGPTDNGRVFRRKLKGAIQDDFAFTEPIGRGLMKRVGCGATVTLTVDLSLVLSPGASGASMATLDTTDGASRGGLRYSLDRAPC